jgi:hypothetical protein
VELGRILGERWPDRDATAMSYAIRYLVPLVQVPPRGLWRRSAAPRLSTLAAWLGLPDGASRDPTGAADALVLRYLRAFGPATVADIRTWSWLVGLRPVIDRLRPLLRTYRDEAGRELFDVDDGALADAAMPAPVRFLGEYDNLFLSHADRSRITGDLAWGTPYVRKGAFFVDGFLAGAWSAAVAGGPGGRATLTIEPRRPITGARDEVAAEAEALLGFLAPEVGTQDVQIPLA